MFDFAAHKKRTAPFMHDRFGMFIHWGLYAIPARGEWIRSFEEITKEDWQQYFYEFNPQHFEPTHWAKVCKQAGMKYAVLTAKHHDGFCLYDSAYTDFKSTNTPFKKDIVAEFVEAFRAEDIKVGLYYSLLDWYHEDYPHYQDERHPMRNNPAYSNENRDFDRYLEYMHNQVRELCTNYGKIDILWFDFSYANMRKETWKGKELIEMVRELQPQAVIDDRLETSEQGFGSLLAAEPSDSSGDFLSPERIIPPKGLQNAAGVPMPWESCITLNNHWGYCATDKEYKQPRTIISKLVECVSKGGNLIVNVGPDANGRIPRESVDILQKVGEWLDYNGASIYGAGRCSIPKPENGRLTCKGDTLYYHVMEPQIDYIPLYGVRPAQIKAVRLLMDGAELPLMNTWVVDKFRDHNVSFVTLGENRLPPEGKELPDPIDTVIEIRLKEGVIEK